ncbi:MAG: hypothetical protein KDA24_08460 [Deltaproteobacteria bacterium]|nr:hypothetical protein [Deltaproteobacteria bacterium]
MIRRFLLPLTLLLLMAAPATGQVPTLQLGAAGSVSLVPPGTISSDGARVGLTLVVSDTGGKLANGVRFKGSAASAGRFDSECSQVGPGLYNCAYTAPERGAQIADLKIRARLESGTNLEASFPLNIVSAARGRVSMNATPDRIVLSQDPTSTLMFTVADKAGNPIDNANLVASSNVGEVQALTPLTGGNYSAVFVPPTTPFPQVAIISVWDKNRPGTNGFFTVPLIGKVNYPVDARAPGVTLIFKVGETTFPPSVTGPDGKASVPITVPPGVKYADVELIQSSGSRSTQKIDLQVPPFNRIAIGGVSEFITADGENKAKVRIFAVDGRGRPADGQTINVSATQGTLSPVRFVRDGVYEAIYTAPRLDGSSRADITATIAGQEATSADTVSIGLERGLPEALTLTADPSNITSSVTKSTLTASIKEKSGTPSETYNIEFRALEGLVANPTRPQPGVFKADVPVQWNVKKTISATAGIRGNKRPVAGLVAFALDDVVLTGQNMPVTIVSVDKDGNPVANAPLNVSVTSGGGSVTTSVQTNEYGLGTVLYAAGPLPGLATVRFDAGNGTTFEAPLWQSQEPVKGFKFPVSGGQDQGRLVARWGKLRASVSLGADQAAEVAPPAGGGTAVWGADGGGETSEVTTDSGSAAPPGTPTSIQVSAVPGNVAANGGSVNILVRVIDSGGILVAGETVILLADGGTISNKVDNGDGTTSALLTIPPNSGKESVRLTATRPAGDLAGFATIRIGAVEPVADATTKPVKEKKPKKQPPAGDDARMKNRFAQIAVGWAPGAYSYDSTPCANTGDGDCNPVADSLLGDYDFLKTEARAATLGSFQIRGEIFPIEYVGAAVSYTRLAYSTDFETSSTAGGSHCSNHFCDGMNFLNIDLQGRLPLLKKVGPLDILARVGYMAQDVVMFRRVLDTTDNVKKPQFDTVNLHGLRWGLGVRYTVLPMLRPHIDYNMTIGLVGAFQGQTFNLAGVTNHNLNVGVNIFPWKGLLLDISYDLTTRALSLRYPNEDNITQRGRINEMSNTVRISAGWAF